jgi:serine protease AprX
MAANRGQTEHGTRMSALWGTGGKRGDASRASALWGKGGRTMVALAIMVGVAVMAPLGAIAGPGPAGPGGPKPKILIPPALLAQAQSSAQSTFNVIIQGDGSEDTSTLAAQVAQLAAQATLGAAATNADAALQPALQNVASATNAFSQAQQNATNAQTIASTKAQAATQAQQAATAAAGLAAQAAAAAKIADASAPKDVAHKADDAAKQAQNTANSLAHKAAQAQQGAAKAQADAAAKAQAAAQAQQALTAAQAALAQVQAADDAAHAAVSQLATDILQQQISSQFSSISAVAATLTGAQVVYVVANATSGIFSVTANGPVQTKDPGAVGGTAPAPPAPAVPAPNDDPHWSSTQVWPAESHSNSVWSKDREPHFAAAQPSIAIVDSGIEQRSDFGSRIIASADLTTLPHGSSQDGRGHGTFVASIAADGLSGITGVDPAANLVDVRVMDDNGMALTSDIINACQWILQHKDQYDIRVANLSFQSQITAPFYIDPLDRAVEQLWFNGIVVVAAAGNYGSADGPSGVLYSPADDPFVITVGAADPNGSADPHKATMAPWSAWGYTVDGFAKPELAAPGRYMIGAVPDGSTLLRDFPDNATSPGYMQLSGTSFAAPVVSGAAANILAQHSDWTPDQVKGALMLTAQPFADSVGAAGGVGLIQEDKAVNQDDPPNPNLALEPFVQSTGAGNGSNGYSFDGASWNSAAKSNASWNSVSWNSASWNSASWNSASWNSAVQGS